MTEKKNKRGEMSILLPQLTKIRGKEEKKGRVFGGGRLYFSRKS